MQSAVKQVPPGVSPESPSFRAGSSWKSDGGDARRFRRAIVARFGPAEGPAEGAVECAAWRYSERILTPLRPAIRQVARALLVHPRPLPYQVTSAIAGPCRVPGGMSDPPATMGSGR